MGWVFTIVPMLAYLLLYVSVHTHYYNESYRRKITTEILANVFGIAAATASFGIVYYASQWLPEQ